MPGLSEAIGEIVAERVAGSPTDEEIRWTCRSPAEITDQVHDQGFAVSVGTVRRILVDDLDLRRRQAVKDENDACFPLRDEQFQHIAQRRSLYRALHWPVLSIDTKQKEILGDFFRPGRAYTDGEFHVQDHDFVSHDGRLVPYGVFDVERNESLMLLALGHDSRELACDAIRRWWHRLGRHCYAGADRMLLLCDSGGSNNRRHYVFKENLCRLAARLGIELEVCHYPPGCSKYNPIEHRVFCHVERSLRCLTLPTIEVAREAISRTRTTSGLRVVAEVAKRVYEVGKKASVKFIERMPISFGPTIPELNYRTVRREFLGMKC